MSIFAHKEFRNHEKILFCYDKPSNLHAIIAIHSTILGPSLGGTRMWMYANDAEALGDVLRLSRGMTYKAAVAGLELGGGKGVIIGDPNKEKTERLFRAYGRCVNSLGGEYITAEDVGTSVEDMRHVLKETKFVTGIDKSLGGSGDPSPVTAYGVYVGMKAAMKELTGSDSLRGKSVAVQGAGHVGQYVCDYLATEGAHIVVTDIYEEKAQRVVHRAGAKFVPPDEIFDADVDIFCPCALGAIINDDTIPRLKAKVIAGGANNQLADEEKHGRMLMERGILYAPDYVINAGGLINVAQELKGYDKNRALNKASKIYDTLLQVFAMAKKDNIPTNAASDRLAEERLAEAARSKSNSNRPSVSASSMAAVEE